MFLRVYAIYRKDKRILALGIVVFIGMIAVASVGRSLSYQSLHESY